MIQWCRPCRRWGLATRTDPADVDAPYTCERCGAPICCWICGKPTSDAHEAAHEQLTSPG